MSHEQFQIAVVDAAPEGRSGSLKCRFLNRVDPEERAFKELRLQELLGGCNPNCSRSIYDVPKSAISSALGAKSAYAQPSA